VTRRCVVWMGLPATRSTACRRGLASLWLFGSRRQALTLLEHRTASFVLPNVRANRPAEAGSVSLVRDDAPCASYQAYAACRSGSG
jgi:hypothetical protein